MIVLEMHLQDGDEAQMKFNFDIQVVSVTF